MEKMEGLDKKSIDYHPTLFEIGYTQEEFDSIDWSDPRKNKEYEERVIRFQLKHRAKLKRIAVKEKERKMQKQLGHWYNTLQTKEIEALIEKSREHVDDVIDKVNEKQTLSRMVSFYENLRYKVKKGKFEIIPATESKLKYFPRYIHQTNQLTGSVYSFAKLWSHVFSTRSSKNGNVTTR